jgi:hypothetical protein
MTAIGHERTRTDTQVCRRKAVVQSFGTEIRRVRFLSNLLMVAIYQQNREGLGWKPIFAGR